MKIIKGQPIAYSDMGTEGVVWSVQARPHAEKWDYANLHTISNGDYLILMNSRKKALWHGEICQEINPTILQEYDVPYPAWIGRWYQKDENKSWGKLFKSTNHAVLIKRK